MVHRDVDVYVKIPAIGRACPTCDWLQDQHEEATRLEHESIAILAKQALIVHLLQFHPDGSLSW